MKRRCVLLSVLLCVLLSAGCSGRNGADKIPGQIKVTAPGEFPIVKEKTELKIMMPASTYVEDFNTNEMTKYYEEKTNVHIVWDIVSGDFEQKKNVLFASGSLPDVIMNGNVTKAQQVSLGAHGLLIPVNDMIERHSKYFKRILEEHPYIRSQITAPDGNIYGFPNISQSSHWQYSNKMWIYKPWLDKLGLKMPETTEEFERTLTAFKEQDPNGNGLADEIPLAAQSGRGYNGIDAFLMNAFIYTSNTDGTSQYPADLAVENGVVTMNAIKPQFREGLRYLKRLYDKGLVAKNSLFMDRSQRTAIVENKGVALVGAVPSMWPGMFTLAGTEGSRQNDFIAVPPLLGPEGVRQTPTRHFIIAASHFNITRQCRNPEVAVRWVDWLYSFEGTLTAVHGKENEGWRRAEAGETGVDGNPAVWTLLGTGNGVLQNMNWSTTPPKFLDFTITLGQHITDPSSSEIMLYKETKEKYEPYAADKDVPDLFFEEAYTAELSDLKNDINFFVEQSIAKFISGQKSLDTDWDAYLQEMRAIGLQRYLELYQQVYEQYVKLQ